MKKSTKKYLLYGAGAYVLLTSGVIGATKVRERSNRLEDLGDDLEAWKGQARQLERDYNEIVATLNSERAAHNAEVEALKAENKKLGSEIGDYAETIGPPYPSGQAARFYNARYGAMQLLSLYEKIDQPMPFNRTGTLREYLAETSNLSLGRNAFYTGNPDLAFDDPGQVLTPRTLTGLNY